MAVFLHLPLAFAGEQGSRQSWAHSPRFALRPVRAWLMLHWPL